MWVIIYLRLAIITFWTFGRSFGEKEREKKKHASLRVPHNFLCNNNLFLDFGYHSVQKIKVRILMGK